MSWPHRKLETLSAPEPYSFVGGPFGSRLTSHDYVAEGVPVIRGSNLNGSRFLSMDNFVFVSDSKVREDLSGNLARAGDLVFTQRGTLGQVAIIPENGLSDRYVISQSQMKITLDENKSDKFFLYYYFSSRQAIEKILNLASSSGVPHINLTALRNFEVPLPSLDTQKRIASILSAYDDLIENNRRRIKLLKQAAQLLYKEWFVHLRFPGHEHVKIKSGVPEGWEKKSLGDVLLELESGSRPKGGARQEGIPSIGAENVTGIGQYDYSKDKFIPVEYFNAMHKGVVRGRDVVVYKDGANIGRSSYFGDRFPHEHCAVNEHVFILRALAEVGQNFLYFWVAHDEVRQQIGNLNANTAQPGVSRSKLKTLSFVQPHSIVANLFNEKVEPMVAQIFLLARKNRHLDQVRDLLLPHLMNGQKIYDNK